MNSAQYEPGALPSGRYSAYSNAGHTNPANIANGTPSRNNRSRAYAPGPMRRTDPGVRSPAIRKSNGIMNSPNGATTASNIASVTGASVTSRTSAYAQSSRAA